MIKPKFSVKTSKRQWIYVISELALLLIVPTIALILTDDSTILCSVLISCIVISIILCVLTIIDGQKRRKVLMEEYLIRQAAQDKVMAFKEKMDNFKYEEADNEYKTDYLLRTLLLATSSGNCAFFKESTTDFKNEEIKSLISNLGISEDFSLFIDEFLLTNKNAVRIFKYHAEVVSLLNNRLFDVPKDELLNDDSVLYDPSMHFRFYTEKKNDDYVVIRERLDIEQSCWIRTEINSLFADEALAHHECVRLYNQHIDAINYSSFYEVEEEYVQ